MYHSEVRVISPDTGKVIDVIPLPSSNSQIKSLKMSDEARAFLNRRAMTLRKRDPLPGEINWARIQFEDRIEALRRKDERKTSDNPAEAQLEIGEIVAKIDNMNMPLRDVLRMYFLQNMTASDIAERTKKTKGAVDLIVYRFRQELDR